MTDREKLDEVIKLLKREQIFWQERLINAMGPSSESLAIAKIEAYSTILSFLGPSPLEEFSATNRPCYDKPAGTPIRHGETV